MPSLAAIPFHPGNAEHIAVIAMTFAVPIAAGTWARRDPTGRRARWIGVAFASVLLVQLVANLVLVGLPTRDRWQEFMPLHLCHFALFACVGACLFQNRLAYELAYFWGLGGTLQGLITPGLEMGFPSLDFVLFFLGHSGIVSCIIFLTLGGRMRPQWRSLLHAFAGILAYAVVAGAFNALFQTNYGFLCAKPAVATLFDWLGPWPWYIASATVLCAFVFVLLYLPWAAADLWRPHQQSRAAE